jgi:hypothetical protein
MALAAQNKAISRRSWLLAGLVIPLFRARAAGQLTVSFDGDNLHIAAPDLHFLSGRALARVRDADTVTFFSQISLFADAQETTLLRRVAERVVVSYALWEEKFAVTIPGLTTRSTMHASAAQAETWAIENLAVSALGLAPNRPLWLRFDLRAATPKELSSVVGDSGVISIRGLVEMLSRKSGTENPRWVLTAGPFRVSDLPRTVFHGRLG